jgi:hypothetical protein
MDAKTYLKVSAMNLVFLGAGLLIGPTIVRSINLLRVVHAQDDGKAPKPPAKLEPAKPVPLCDDTKFECVSPSMTTGAAGFNQLLAHQIATDQIMVQGIDLLKLHESTLNLLRSKNIATLPEIQKVVDDSRALKPLRLK